MTGQEQPTGAAVLCGVDGGPEARLALRVAAGLARRLGLRLVVSHVVALPPPEPRQAAPAPASAVDARLAAADAFLRALVAEEGLSGARVRTALGHPAERLADLADEEGAQLIVVGSRGRGPFRAAFLGSVSNALVGLARCPVIVVPHGVATAEPLAGAVGHG